MQYKTFTIQYYGSGVYIYGTSGIVRNFPTVQEAIEYIDNLNG